MKYTSKNIYNKKVAVKCENAEQQLYFIRSLGAAGNLKLKYGGTPWEDVDLTRIKYSPVVIGRYNPTTKKDLSICTSSNDWYEEHGFEVISFQTFLEHNPKEILYEIY